MIPRESRIRDILRLIVWYPFRWLTLILPVSVNLFFFRTLGRIHFCLGKKRVQELLENMKALPENLYDASARRTEALHYLENHYLDRLHIFLYPRLRNSPTRTRRLIRIQGKQNLHTALQTGKGAILIHGHFGVIQLPLFALHHASFHPMQIGLPSAQGVSAIGRATAFRLRLKYEQMLPCKILTAGSYLRPAFRHLRKGGVLLITGDGAGGGRFVGRFVTRPFLDAGMAFPTGAVELARQTGAPLLPAFVVPDRDGGYKFLIGRPLELHANTPRNQADPDLDLFPQLLERFILRYPSLWHFWDEWTDGKLRRSRTDNQTPSNHPDYPQKPFNTTPKQHHLPDPYSPPTFENTDNSKY